MTLLRRILIFIFLAYTLLSCTSIKAQLSFTFNQTLYDKKWNDEPEIVFGQSTALTGQTRELGYPLMVGAQAAFKEINELGGVWGGKKLRLYSLDDGYEPARCINNTLNLLNNQSIFGFLGFMGTGTSQAILNLLIESKIPYIGALTGGLFLRVPFYPNLINVRASYQDETAAMVEYLVNIKMLRRISIFYQNDAFGVSGLDGSTLALNALGMSLVSKGTYERNTIEVTNALNSIVKGKPQAIICMSTYKPTVEFINRVMARTDYDPDILFMTGSFIGSNILPHRDRVVVTQVFPAPTNTKYPIVLSYQRAMKAYNPSFVPSLVELEGYMAAKLTINVLTQRVSGDLTRSHFIDLLYESGTYVMDNTVVGPYTKCSTTTSSSRRSTFIFEENTSSSNKPTLTEITPSDFTAKTIESSETVKNYHLRSDWTSRRVLSSSSSFSSSCSCNQGLRSVWKTVQNADASFTEIGDPIVWDLPGSSSFSCFFDPTKISLPIVFGHISDGSAYNSDFISGVSAAFKDRNDKQGGVRGKRLEILPIVMNDTSTSVESLLNASRKFVVDHNAIGLVGSKINSISTASSFLEQFASQFSSMVLVNPETSFDSPKLREHFSMNIIHLKTSIRERLLSLLDYSMNTLGLTRFSFIGSEDTDGKYVRSQFMRMLEEYELYLDSEIMFSPNSNTLSTSQIKDYLMAENANPQVFVISLPNDEIEFNVVQKILTGISSIKLREEVVVFCLYFKHLQWESRIADLLNSSSFSSIHFYLVEPFPYVHSKHSFIDTYQSIANKYLANRNVNTTGVVEGFLVGSFIIEILDNISPQTEISGSSFIDTVFSNSEFIKYQIPFGQFSTTKKCSLGMRSNYIFEFVSTRFVPVSTVTFDKSKCGVDVNALKDSVQAPIIFGKLYPVENSSQVDEFKAGVMSFIQALNDNAEIPRKVHLYTEYYTSDADMMEKAATLIERNKVFGFLGSKISGNASGLRDLVDSHDIPLIGPVSGHPDLRSPFSRFIINLRPSIVEEVVTVARYARSLFFQTSEQLSLTILVANQEYWTSASKSVEEFFLKSAENVKISTLPLPTLTKRSINNDVPYYGNFVFVLANSNDACSFIAQLAQQPSTSLIGIPSEISCPTLSGLKTNVITASFLEPFSSASFTNIMAKEFIQYYSQYYPQMNKTMLAYEGFAVGTMVGNILKYMDSVNLEVTKQSFISTLFYRSVFELGVNDFGPYGDTCDSNGGSTSSGGSFTRSISSSTSATCSSTTAFCSCNQGAKEIYLNFLQDFFLLKKIQNYSLRFQTCGITYIVPGLSAGAIAGIVIGGTLFFIITLIICIVVVVIARRDPTAKYAPKSGKITCAFTDVQNSTKLWQNNEKAMRTALEIHNSIMRSKLMQFRGYEVKTNGDSFYVVFKDPLDAVIWAMEVQLALLNAKWPGDLYHEWDCRQEWDPKSRKAFWSGLRVRIGLHYGKGDCVWDKTMKRFDYFGNVVNKSARIEALAHGGQVLVSEELFYKTRELYSNVEFMSETADGKTYLSVDGARHHPLSETQDTPSSSSFTSSTKSTSKASSFKSKRQRVAIERTFTARDLGVYPLKGLSESSRVFEIKCAEIESRTYPPLRVALEDLDRSESSVQREYQDLKKRHELNRRSSHGSVSEASAYDPGFDALDDQQPSPEEHQEHP